MTTTATVTSAGILVTYDNDDLDDERLDETVDSAFRAAVTRDLGVSPKQVESVTRAQDWYADGGAVTRQWFTWLPGVDATNWRARIS